MPEISFTPELLAKHNIPDDAVIETWDSINQKTVLLAEKIIADTQPQAVSEYFQNLVIIPRGGLHIANVLGRLCNFDVSQYQFLSLSTYQGAEKTDEVVIGQYPARHHISGSNCLIVDEICDSAFTLEEATKILNELGAATVKTATVHYKPTAKHLPDFYVESTEKWIVYPWEIFDLSAK